MRQNIIVAVDDHGGFGKDGKIPWHFKEDLQNFAKITKGSNCVMGRNTYEDMLGYFKGDSFLPGRQCWVVTSQQLETRFKNVKFIKSISEYTSSPECLESDTFYLGGERIFGEALNVVDNVYATIVPGNYNCDRFFEFGTFKFWGRFDIVESREGSEGLLFNKYSRI